MVQLWYKSSWFVFGFSSLVSQTDTLKSAVAEGDGHREVESQGEFFTNHVRGMREGNVFSYVCLCDHGVDESLVSDVMADSVPEEISKRWPWRTRQFDPRIILRNSSHLFLQELSDHHHLVDLLHGLPFTCSNTLSQRGLLLNTDWIWCALVQLYGW